MRTSKIRSIIQVLSVTQIHSPHVALILFSRWWTECTSFCYSDGPDCVICSMYLLIYWTHVSMLLNMAKIWLAHRMMRKKTRGWLCLISIVTIKIRCRICRRVCYSFLTFSGGDFSPTLRFNCISNFLWFCFMLWDLNMSCETCQKWLQHWSILFCFKRKAPTL